LILDNGYDNASSTGRDVMASRLSQAEAAAAQAPPWLTHVAAAAAVLVTAVNGSLGPLGVAVGSERFFRNSAGPFYLALACSALALFLVGAAYLQGDDATKLGRKNLYALFALALVSLAVIFGAFAIANAGAEDHGPTISASISEDGSLTGSVSVAGLSGGQRLWVELTAITDEGETTLDQATLGPGADGSATLSLNRAIDLRSTRIMQVEAWVPDLAPWSNNPGCAEERNFLETQTYACLRIPVAAVTVPSISLSFSGDGPGRTLTGRAAAVAGVGEVLHVIVLDSETQDVLYETMLIGDRGQELSTDIAITVGQEHHAVCGVALVATSRPTEPRCPPDGTEGAWIILRTAAIEEMAEPSASAEPMNSAEPSASLPTTSSSSPAASQDAP
jgi:hypothetical protein